MSEFIFYALGILSGLVWAYSSVTENQWSHAQELCASNGGLSGYVSHSVGYPKVTCVNGAKFTLEEK